MEIMVESPPPYFPSNPTVEGNAAEMEGGRAVKEVLRRVP
jgi:hypothetical protein